MKKKEKIKRKYQILRNSFAQASTKNPITPHFAQFPPSPRYVANDYFDSVYIDGVIAVSVFIFLI